MLIPPARERGQAGSAVVLTFAHQIADGVGGLRALSDLTAALDGDRAAPGRVPEAQEDLLAALGAPADGLAGTPPDDDRMHVPGELVPFSGRAPHVDAAVLDTAPTARLVRRCRVEGTTVHAVLCAAAATVFHRQGRAFVRVLSPVDLRRAVGLADEVVVRFAGARTASDAADADDFWALARRTHASLARQRTAGVLAAGAAALAARPPSEPDAAEAMMAAVTAADVQITNLGVVDPGGVRALWGPAQITQLRSEHILGVVTVGGRLRMTELTHDPVDGLVERIVAVLVEETAA